MVTKAGRQGVDQVGHTWGRGRQSPHPERSYRVRHGTWDRAAYGGRRPAPHVPLLGDRWAKVECEWHLEPLSSWCIRKCTPRMCTISSAQ